MTITIGFSVGVFLSYFGQPNILASLALALSCLAILILFWTIKPIRLISLALMLVFLGFAYPLLLHRDSLITISAQNPILIFFGRMGESFVSALQKVLPEPEASLAAGLVIGTQGGFPPELKQEFINTGTIHLIAVSGFNVTIVLKIFSDWLKPFGRWIAFIVGTLGLVGFIIITGGQASVVRAGIMGWLFLLAMFSFRQFHVRNALFIAGAIMIAFEPKIIVTGIGFQLSFGAMLGLIYISPLIKGYIEKNNILKRIPNFLSAALEETLGAQIAVAFLILGHFGRLSLIAPIPNLLIVPMVFAPMFLAIGIGLLAMVINTSAVFFAIPLIYFLKYILSVIHLFNLKWGSIQFDNWNWTFVGVGYLILIIFIYYLNLRKNRPSPLSLLNIRADK